MHKLMLTGQHLGGVFKSRLGRVCIGHELYTFCKTAQLKVENSAQTTFRLSPVSFRAPRCWYLMSTRLSLCVYYYYVLYKMMYKIKNLNYIWRSLLYSYNFSSLMNFSYWHSKVNIDTDWDWKNIYIFILSLWQQQ